MNKIEYEEIRKNREKYKIFDNQYKCPVCGKNFSINSFSIHIFKQHVNADNGIKNSGGYNGHYDNPSFLEKISHKSQQYCYKRWGTKIERKVVCFKCHKEFEIFEREKDKKEKYFCSRKCANSHCRTEESRNKTSLSLKRFYNNCKKTCLRCGENIISKRAKYCSKECKNLHKWEIKLNKTVNDIEKEKILIKKYKSECSFKFNLSDYPDEFDFELVKKFGWYKAKNNGDNLNGVSRDHMYSVMDGYRNKIEPSIISHPANCRLIRHNENISKLDNSIITIEQLIKRIDDWDKKYKILH